VLLRIFISADFKLFAYWEKPILIPIALRSIANQAISSLHHPDNPAMAAPGTIDDLKELTRLRFRDDCIVMHVPPISNPIWSSNQTDHRGIAYMQA
jgi:hypothetical protein